MKDRDGDEWVLVPREAVRKMLDAAHFGPNCAEYELSEKDEQFWLEVWGAMIAAAPQFVAGEVTKEMCWNVFEDCDGCEKNMAETARHWLDRWRKELGPALGLVTRDELTIRDTEIARLETDLELARINAARYFWLRDDWYLSGTEDRCLDEVLDLTHRVTPAKMDAAIDEARAGNGGEG